jgi:hypothetical protein
MITGATGKRHTSASPVTDVEGLVEMLRGCRIDDLMLEKTRFIIDPDLRE